MKQMGGVGATAICRSMLHSDRKMFFVFNFGAASFPVVVFDRK
jgi:hypothetical protein